MEQQIRVCKTSDGVRIAYATIGEGPPLVRAAHWLSHLEFELESPVWRHWIRELSRYHLYVRYDERGCGLSDWKVEDFSFEAWVRDLETVVDSIGLDRFILLGVSQGGPVSIAYAARHPDRVSHLILYGAYARGWAKRDSSPETIEAREAVMKLTRLGWGQDNPAYRQMFTSSFIPDATIEQMHWFNDLQRISTSPENAVRFQMGFGKIDVLNLTPQISVPTLILHAREDAAVPFENGRQLAALISGARFVPLEGRNHILLEDEPAWTKFLYEMRSFVGVKERIFAFTQQVATPSPSTRAVAIGTSGSPQIFKFKSGKTSLLFDHLVDAFMKDYMVRKFVSERSGWRSLVEIARETGTPISTIYGRKGGVGPVLEELIQRGLVETRLFPGERGRGGEVMRLRIAYEKDPVKEYVNQRIRIRP